ncbi:N-acetyl-alpha-D-glucosaminyl L-malate synthase BshA [Jannaschia seosinensis]|uniref:N-acetyl-alpha-D-glucosaminyl L-malate synthase BshA n=1 Tax=Jannaschia seosinensis TaxID=313367 RepID=A0A0M7B7L2_9RHOB|nr:glycosyltransferase [Jannaschia seosinensis]CUH20417.1 N-acetyl-alpha-D-glucosaminyl L-malate synthase BshA [Jannaschia seosinensis]
MLIHIKQPDNPLIGDGPERARLEALVAELDLGARVRFLGERAYGSALIGDLADYDGLLFTPLSEDTPRMIFDGYAAGLPLIGFDIPYVRERATEEHACVPLPFEDISGSADILGKLTRDRPRLASLARAAHHAAAENASDVWYRRRADWTIEAHERRIATA